MVGGSNSAGGSRGRVGQPAPCGGGGTTRPQALLQDKADPSVFTSSRFQKEPARPLLLYDTWSPAYAALFAAAAAACGARTLLIAKQHHDLLLADGVRQ